jgi:Do/DeqQ family serine protease
MRVFNFGEGRVRAVAGALLFFSGLAISPPAIGQTADAPSAVHNPIYSFAPIVEKVSPAVVNIYARKIVRPREPRLLPSSSALWRLFRDSLLFGYGRERIQNALGSGVIVRPEGIIVTNHHVIDAAEGIAIALDDGRIFEAKVLLSDKRTDIAVLSIETGGERLPFVEFGDSDHVKVGDIILAIGNPFGLEQTVTSGIISAVARTSVGITDLRFFIQTDAAINPGNSGGPQIGMDGKLVGINTAIYSSSVGAEGLGFAIPSNMVRVVVETAIQNKPLVRPWIGISGRSITPQWAALLGLPRPRGVLITDTYKGSPAEEAGLMAGDVVLQVGDFVVDDPQALRYRIATQMVGTSVRLVVVRRGARIELTVPLEPPPAEPVPNERWISNIGPFSGAKVASLSPALAEDLGLDSGIGGVVVLDVAPGSAADRLGLRAGDIIRALDGRDIGTVPELLAFKAAPFRRWSMIINRAGQNFSISGQ